MSANSPVDMLDLSCAREYGVTSRNLYTVLKIGLYRNTRPVVFKRPNEFFQENGRVYTLADHRRNEDVRQD